MLIMVCSLTSGDSETLVIAVRRMSWNRSRNPGTISLTGLPMVRQEVKAELFSGSGVDGQVLRLDRFTALPFCRRNFSPRRQARTVLPSQSKGCKSAPICTLIGCSEIRGTLLEGMAGTAGLEPARPLP